MNTPALIDRTLPRANDGRLHQPAPTCVTITLRPDGTVSIGRDTDKPQPVFGLRAERARELFDKAVALAECAPT